MTSERIIEILNTKGIICTDSQADLLFRYMKGILDWNERINLTAIKDEEEFILKHYADSLSIINEPEYQEAETIIDIGTGGGFPGIPLAIMSPEKKYVLLDSLEKRLKIIDGLCQHLGIENVKTLHERAEDAGRNPEYREQFDLCVSRAVADLAVLSEYCLPFVKADGSFIAYKGKEIEEELMRSEKSIKLLGGETDRITGSITDQQLVIIKKTKPTPLKYPRKPGEPKKKPF